MKHILIVLLMLPNLYRSTANPHTTITWGQRVVEPALLYGYVWPHNPSLSHLSNKHFALFQLQMARTATGKHLWHHQYRFPETGINLLAGDLGYPEVLGRAFALIPYIRQPIQTGQFIQWHFHFGAGLGYLSRSYDRITNFKNNAIGSHLNIAFQTRIECSSLITKHSRLSAGIGMVHFSNGGFRKPNRGINIPVVYLALGFSDARSAIIQDPFPPPPGPPEMPAFTMTLGGGLSDLTHTSDILYGAISCSITARLMAFEKRKLGIGADLFYDASDKAFLQNKSHSNVRFGQVIKGGIHLAYEQHYGKLNFLLHGGYYLHSRHKGTGAIYNRVGFRYLFKQEYFVHLCLNSHTLTATFVEAGFGIYLGKKHTKPPF